MWIPFGYGLGSLSVEAKVSAVLLMLLYPRMDEWWATLVKSSFSFIRTPHKAPGCSFVLRRTLRLLRAYRYTARNCRQRKQPQLHL